MLNHWGYVELLLTRIPVLLGVSAEGIHDNAPYPLAGAVANSWIQEQIHSAKRGCSGLLFVPGVDSMWSLRTKPSGCLPAFGVSWVSVEVDLAETGRNGRERHSRSRGVS